MGDTLKANRLETKLYSKPAFTHIKMLRNENMSQHIALQPVY